MHPVYEHMSCEGVHRYPRAEAKHHLVAPVDCDVCVHPSDEDLAILDYCSLSVQSLVEQNSHMILVLLTAVENVNI